MTTSLRDAVRRTCTNGGGLDWECRWPDCRCGALSERHLTALIDQARAEEREAAAKVATDRAAYARKQATRHGIHTMEAEPWTEAAESFEDIAAAPSPLTEAGDE